MDGVALTISDILLLAALAAATGSCAGFLSGILGVGGGIVIVPVLHYIFRALDFSLETSLHVAIGTSLATIIATQWRSAQGHRARGSFDDRTVISWSLPIILGSAIGVVLAGILPGRILAFVFSFGMMIVAVIMIYQTAFLKKAELLGEHSAQISPLRFPVAAGSGALSTIMGIGGGTFNVLALTMLFKMDMRRAIGTSSGLGVLIGLVGAFGFIWAGWGIEGRMPLSLGYVNLIGAAAVAPFAILFSPLGVSAAHKVEQKTLRILFAGVLVIGAANLFYEAAVYGG